MTSIWFQQRFVEAILSGEKTDTIRKIGRRPPPLVGETVAFSVGPRPPFATATVTAVVEIRAKDLSADYCELLRGIYGDFDRLRKISFTLMPSQLLESQIAAPPDRLPGRRIQSRR
jgi:uncharacterized protein YqfB (UPF0267 family)